MTRVAKTLILKSVRSNVIFPVLMLYVLLAALAIVLLSDRMEKQLFSAVKQQAETVTALLQGLAEDPVMLNRSIESLVREKRVSFVNVVPLPSNTDMVHKTLSGLSTAHEEYVLKLFSMENKSFFSLDKDNSSFIYVAMLSPREGGVGHVAAKIIIVGIDASEHLSDIRDYIWASVVVFFIVVVAVLTLIYIMLTRYVLNPIDSITRAVKQRAHGKENTLIETLRSDEIGVLQKALNELAEMEGETKRSLHERERELNIIFDNVPVKIWYKDDKNTILRLNKKAAISMNMSVEDVEGKNTADLFPEMAEKYLQDDLEVIRSGKPKLDIVERYTPLAGNPGWVKTDKVPYVLADKQQQGVLVVAQDVTVLKKTEDDLRESQERFQLVIQATRDGIWDWPDMSTDEEYWSPQLKSLLGYRENEIEAGAKKFFSMLHPDDIEKTEDAVKNCVERDKPIDLECRVKTKSGDYKWFQARGVISSDSETGVQRMTGSMTDIQYRKDAEIKLLQQNTELERSNRELDEFAYVASHDLKSPLRGIDQLANWVAEDLSDTLTDETKNHLALMRSRVQRMDRLLTDLLTYSQVGRRQQSMVMVDVRILVPDLFSLCSPPADFRLQLNGDLPCFETLGAPFEQVLRNILSNAIKHHDRKDGLITFSCKSKDTDKVYEFEVTDDGPGIDKRYHELVFKMFKALKPRDDVEGSGIGLALIKKIVETYGGQVRFVSQVGQGTTFYFTWPKALSGSIL